MYVISEITYITIIYINLLLLFIQHETRKIQIVPQAAGGICIMHRILCACARSCEFFSSHEKTERWFAMEAKEKELRRTSTYRVDHDSTSKNSGKTMPCVSKRKGTRMHRDTREPSPSRSTRNAVKHRWASRLYLYFPRRADHLLLISIYFVFAAHSFYYEKDSWLQHRDTLWFMHVQLI